MAVSLQNDLEAAKELDLKTTMTMTRSRRGKPAPEVTALTEQVCTRCTDSDGTTISGDWTKKDNKRMVRMSYIVHNLEGTIKCYTDYLGMLLLDRSTQGDGTINAMLAFGPRNHHFVLGLAYHEGVNDLCMGQGFGHISITSSDVPKLTKEIKTSTCCEVAHLRCRQPGASTQIVFAHDPNNILFEIVQNKYRPNAICRILLYVADLDRSITFYQKALGMTLFRKKDMKNYNCAGVLLGYGNEHESTVLELRCSDHIKQYRGYGNEHESTVLELRCSDHIKQYRGNAYGEITIGTRDVKKSTEVLKQQIGDLGGKILVEPGDSSSTCIFCDPNGWPLVLVEDRRECHEEMGLWSGGSEY